MAIGNAMSISLIWRWKTSTTPALKPSRRRLMASSIAPCKKSSTASRFTKSSIPAWTSCRLTSIWLREYNEKSEHSGEYCHGENALAHFPGFQTPGAGENAQLLTATSSSDVEGRRAGAHGAAAQDGLCQIKVSARTGQDADHVVSSIEVHARTDDRTYPDCNQKDKYPVHRHRANACSM